MDLNKQLQIALELKDGKIPVFFEDNLPREVFDIVIIDETTYNTYSVQVQEFYLTNPRPFVAVRTVGKTELRHSYRTLPVEYVSTESPDDVLKFNNDVVIKKNGQDILVICGNNQHVMPINTFREKINKLLS